MDSTVCFRETCTLWSCWLQWGRASPLVQTYQFSSFGMDFDMSPLWGVSQNCRGWKGPLEIIISNPLLKQVPYCRSHSRQASGQVLNISGEGDSTISLGSLFQCSVILTVKKKKVLSCVCVEFSVFWFLPICLTSQNCSFGKRLSFLFLVRRNIVYS